MSSNSDLLFYLYIKSTRRGTGVYYLPISCQPAAGCAHLTHSIHSMTRTSYALHNVCPILCSWLAIGANCVEVSTTRISQIQAFKISTLNSGHYISVVTIAKDHNSLRVPLIDYRFERWPVPQPCVHDCDVIFRGSRFRLFFQRHKMLPRHPSLNFRGELIIMRLSKTQTTNVVNLRAGDSKLARQIARR